jgi:hypothetical protein
MGTYVHHPSTKVNFNKLIGRIVGGKGGGGFEKSE